MPRGVAKCQRGGRNYYLFIFLALLWEPQASIPLSFRAHNLQEEIPATPLILIPNLGQETNKLQMNTPGCFLNLQRGLWEGEHVIHPPAPPNVLSGSTHLTGCQGVPMIGSFLLATKYVLHFNVSIITLYLWPKQRSLILGDPGKELGRVLYAKGKEHILRSQRMGAFCSQVAFC